MPVFRDAVRCLTAVCSLLLAVLPTAARAATVPLVAAGSSWKYLDDGTNQGTAWRAPAFADAGWASGTAQLGYGDGDETTPVSFGGNASNRYVTTYFRRTFSVTDPTALTSLTLRLLRDDGAVVYLNGAEVFRSNMPSGTVAYTTLASTTVAGTSESTFVSTSLSASLLAAGTNVLAVEVHQAAPDSSDLSFDLELTGSDSVTLSRGPYLQLATPTSIVVRWRTAGASDSLVNYGAAPSRLDRDAYDATPKTEHEVELVGLSPGTLYYYSVGSSQSAATSSTLSFVTPPSSSRATRIWVLGDSGMANEGARAVRDAYATYTGTRPTDLWLMLGDNAYDSGTDAQYQAGVFDTYPAMLRQSPLWPTIGNHDTADLVKPPADFPYLQIFTLPANGEAGGLPSGTERYYSYDHGNIHFVCLDSMTQDRSATGPMATWLASDLAANTRTWTIAYWHHPPYTRGSYNSDTALELRQMREGIVPILESHGVDLVLTGHSHSYERSFLIDGHYGTAATFAGSMKKDGGSGRENETGAYRKPTAGPAPHEGTVYVVSGTAAEVIVLSTLDHPAMYVSRGVLGSLVIDVDGARMDVRFVRETGAVEDSFTIIKGDATAPVAPSGLAATAPSATAVALGWTDNASNEDGFKIERATGGGAFAQVATVGANVTTYLDSVSAGTSYAYRVRAYSAAGGNSAYSNTSTVTTPTGTTAVTLVATGSSWKYLDDGSNQATAWRAPSFADAGWASGAAQLGYGDGDERTVVSYGASSTSKHVTTYFRRAFSVSDPAAIASLTLRLLRDDGAVVYLNGTEVFRSNMPSGTVSYTTLASTVVSESSETTYVSTSVSPSLLVAGTNVLAVELHQATVDSSDISFDLELRAP